MAMLQRVVVRTSRPRGAWALGVVWSLALAVRVHAQVDTAAQPAQPTAAARPAPAREDAVFTSEFSSGLRAEDERNFDGARLHYERALARAEALDVPAPRLRALLALGWVHYNLGNQLRSVEYLKRAVADPALPSAREREAQALIAEEMKVLGQLQIDIRPPEGQTAKVAVQVDRRGVADPRDVPVAPGSHQVRATAPGYRELVQEAVVAAGQLQPVSGILEREQAMSGTRRAAWIVGGVAALSLAVGIGAGTYAWVKNEASDDCKSGVDCVRKEVDARNAAIVAGNVSTVAWVLGGVGGAAAAYLFWKSASEDDERAVAPRTRVGVGLASVRVTHAW